ncbi:MAG: helix-turn-helix transcriptional regulator [Halobacteriaceae archaeon]
MGAVNGRVCAVLVAASLAILVGAVPAGGAAANAAGPDGPAAAGPPGLDQMNFEPSETLIHVHLRENGSARWTITYKLELVTENDTAAFRELQDDIRTNTSSYVDEFAAGIDATVADASNATGREMTARNYSVSTSHDRIQDLGYVTYEFTWAGFAAESRDRIVAGDALAGFFLESGTTLRFSWPAPYDLRSVQPPADESENSVSWSGAETTFGASGPRVVVTKGGGGPPWALTAGIVLVGVGAAAGAFVYLRRREAEAEDTPAETEPATPGESETAPTAGGEAEAEAEAETETEEPPAELLSNEERVLRLLENRGGRVKQQEIVSEFDWTAAKTSQVVSEMHEAGQIEKFRLGRENVIKLPEEDGGDES